MAVNSLPRADRIEGLQLHLSGKADPSTHLVELQYTARTPSGVEQWHSLQMPLLDALYLLNLLEAMTKENGFEHLRRPPGSAPQ